MGIGERTGQRIPALLLGGADEFARAMRAYGSSRRHTISVTRTHQ
ncbi:hypothetical protein [Streptomyces flaveus]